MQYIEACTKTSIDERSISECGIGLVVVRGVAVMMNGVIVSNRFSVPAN
jgi:hypothetical protein